MVLENGRWHPLSRGNNKYRRRMHCRFFNKQQTCIERQPGGIRHAARISLCALVLLLATAAPLKAENDSIELPELGDASAGLMSPAREHALGQAWLRSFRAHVPLSGDPLIYEYLEDLLFKLASYSELDTRNFDLVVVQNPTLNAFAVPGRVVGVHTGLFLYAETEAQLASVLAHELAHLSQRHFARSIEAAKRTNFMTLAGMLAGLALAAAGGDADAATAAIVTSQAAALDQQLRYSRLHEREADRQGMKTLHAAGYSATAVANMFKQMLDAQRLYGSKIPEFLLTHPITQSRVADASSRARQMEQHALITSIEYQLIRTRVMALSSSAPKDIVAELEAELDKRRKNASLNEAHKTRLHYGIALGYHLDKKPEKAREYLAPLVKQIPGRISITLLDIELDAAVGNLDRAEQRLRDLNSLIPNNYAIGMLLSKFLTDRGAYDDAVVVLKNLAQQRPQQADIWYHLAEAEGLAGNIVDLHQSRAEFFVLRANFTQARKQLQYALQISRDNHVEAATIKQRLNEFAVMELQQREL